MRTFVYPSCYKHRDAIKHMDIKANTSKYKDKHVHPYEKTSRDTRRKFKYRFISLFNGISTCMGYLMLKHSSCTI